MKKRWERIKTWYMEGGFALVWTVCWVAFLAGLLIAYYKVIYAVTQSEATGRAEKAGLNWMIRQFKARMDAEAFQTVIDRMIADGVLRKVS